MKKITINIWPEMGQRLGVSRATAYELANSDGFPILRIGKRMVVPVSALEQWIADNTASKCNSN